MIPVFRIGLAALAIAAIAVPLRADPMQDICHERAKSASGYSGAPGLTFQSGRTRATISGSVGVGLSYNSSPGAGQSAPSSAGSASIERSERDAERKYRRLYDNCMHQR